MCDVGRQMPILCWIFLFFLVNSHITTTTVFQQSFPSPTDLASLFVSIMGQSSSKHGREANKTKTGLALRATGKRLVDKLRHSHPAAVQLQSSVHDDISDPTPACTLHTLSKPSADMHNAIGKIPVEVFLNIVIYLSPASVRSLSYTCRSLSHIFGASAVELMGESPFRPHLERPWDATDRWYPWSMLKTSSAHLGKAPSEWWKLMIMLHRDNMWPGKAVCRACIGVHDIAAFSPSYLRGPQTESKCLGWSGWVNICSHMEFDFLDLKEKCNSPETYKRIKRDEHTRSSKTSHYADEDDVAGARKARLTPKQTEEAEAKRVQSRKQTMLDSAKAAAEEERVWTMEKKMTCNHCAIPVTITSWGRSRVCFPLTVKRRDWPGKPRRKDFTFMGSPEAAVCPHLTLNSSIIVDAYCANSKRLSGGGCNCRKCAVPYHQCALCHAKLWYDIGDYLWVSNVTYLIVERSFDPSVGIANSAWLNQLSPRRRG